MKRILGVVTAWAALVGGVYGQPLSADKVPASVRDGFRKKFRTVDKVEWKRKTDKNYEAEFTLKGAEVAAKFNDKGKWLETETTIDPSALPKEVQATLAREYKGYKIIETQTVERAGAKPILFEVHLENAGEILKVQLERDGMIVSKSSKKKKKP